MNEYSSFNNINYFELVKNNFTMTFELDRVKTVQTTQISSNMFDMSKKFNTIGLKEFYINLFLKFEHQNISKFDTETNLNLTSKFKDLKTYLILLNLSFVKPM